MKSFALLLLPAGLCFAQEFTTGQAARLVIGQTTFTRQEPGTSATVLGAVSGLAYANNTLFVVDSNRVGAFPQNNRVLIYRNLNAQLPQPGVELPSPPERRCQVCVGMADTVIGQASFDKGEIGLSQTAMRQPTAVATDGRILAVADTDNNRVLIWNSIPTSNGQPADVVVGQTNFTSSGANAGAGSQANARGFRGPQGVWIQDGKLLVADTQNHRVMIWNQIPTSNGVEANVVLGQANFTTIAEQDLLKLDYNAQPTNMLNPVSVTSDGTRLLVTDLGYNRILVWNTIPTSNQAPADFALGQPDVASTQERPSVANNSKFLCDPVSKDSAGADVFPARCAATVDFPRYALSDGKRFFVADGGNNRILIWNTVPTRSGQPADIVIGQSDDTHSDEGGSGSKVSAADALRTPMSLAWDGANLYVSDPYDRRVMVFTLGDATIGRTSIRNAASREVFAVASVTVSGTIKENDEGTIKIGDREYKYKVIKDDTIAKVINAFVNLINKDAGDPNVLARANTSFNGILLTARKPGEAGNGTTLSTSVSTAAELVLTASSGQLSGGQSAANIAPGTLISIQGSGFSDTTVNAPTTGEFLPTTLGGLQVYADGQRLPLLMVSPAQITAQIPFEVADTSSISLYIRRSDSRGVRVTNAIGVPIVPTNPGLFALEGDDPRPAIAVHASSSAQGVISVDGSIKAGDVATVTVEDRSYTYTVKAEDRLDTVRDALITAINDDPKVFAYPAGQYTRIRIQARESGEAGNGIPLTAKVNDGASLILTALTTELCCANEAGAPITEANPAKPGEVIIVYATGLGTLRGDNTDKVQTGQRYDGSGGVTLNFPIDDAIAGGRTANVLFAGPRPGEVGVYEVHMLLNSDIPTNPQTQLTIAQDIYVSNIVTFPVVNPKPAE